MIVLDEFREEEFFVGKVTNLWIVATLLDEGSVVAVVEVIDVKGCVWGIGGIVERGMRGRVVGVIGDVWESRRVGWNGYGCGNWMIGDVWESRRIGWFDYGCGNWMMNVMRKRRRPGGIAGERSIGSKMIGVACRSNAGRWWIESTTKSDRRVIGKRSRRWMILSQIMQLITDSRWY